MVDRTFAIVCWICLIHAVPKTGQMHTAQYFTMMALVGMESVHSCLSFRKFFLNELIAPPHIDDCDQLGVRVNHVQLERIKQLFEYVGMALFILPWTKYLGLLLLVVVEVPLQYELLREKTRKKVFYFVETGKTFDHKSLKTWMQLKTLASKFIVGVPRRDAMEMVMNACASNVVDEVVVEAPTKVDLLFVEKQEIDYVVVRQTTVVTDEVVNSDRVLMLDDHGQLHRVRPKAAEHKE